MYSSVLSTLVGVSFLYTFAADHTYLLMFVMRRPTQRIKLLLSEDLPKFYIHLYIHLLYQYFYNNFAWAPIFF